MLKRTRFTLLFCLLAVAIFMADGAVVFAVDLQGRRIYVNEAVSAKVKSQYPRWGAQDAIIINGNGIDPDDDGVLNVAVLQAAVAAQVPVGYTGLVVLDWENTGIANLQTANGGATQVNAVAQYVLGLQTAKAIRPTAQFGYYALPPRRYYNRDQSWHDQAVAINSIYAASDCLFPSVYDFYNNTSSPPDTTLAADLAYVRENVALALEMAAGKPVYAYIWPRYHHSNPTYGGQLIPESEFKAHVAAIFEASWNGKKADGLVWWGADYYWRLISHPGNPNYSAMWDSVFATELPAGVPESDYFDRIHMATLRQISETMGTPYTENSISAYNFPNPFDLSWKQVSTLGGGNPTIRGTMIQVSVPPGTSGDATIQIFDVAGEKIRTLQLGAVSGNYYYKNWDGRNDRGQDVARGVYMGVVKIGSKTHTFKMAVVK